MPILTDEENEAQKVQGGELFKYKSSEVISLLSLKPSHGLQIPDYSLKAPEGSVTVGSPACFSHLLTIPYILWPLFIPETYQDHSHLKALAPAIPSAWNVLPFLDRTDFSLLTHSALFLYLMKLTAECLVLKYVLNCLINLTRCKYL